MADTIETPAPSEPTWADKAFADQVAANVRIDCLRLVASHCTNADDMVKEAAKLHAFVTGKDTEERPIC